MSTKSRTLISPCRVVSVVASTLLLAAAHARQTKASPETKKEDLAPRIAVIEMFTSEGCSSCPPADGLLGTLESKFQPPKKGAAATNDGAKETDNEAQPEGKPARPLLVIPLAFHVDYWDKLGWPDRFAQAAFTARQGEHVKTLKVRSMYTPQAVVNGERDIVANQERPLVQAIRDAKVASVKVLCEATVRDGQMPKEGPGKVVAAPSVVEVAITLAPYQGTLPMKLTVNAALTESGLSTECTRGENAGKTLRHDHVVRALASLPFERATKGPLSISLTLPADAVKERTRYVVWVQEPRSGRVVGAMAAQVPLAAKQAK